MGFDPKAFLATPEPTEAPKQGAVAADTTQLSQFDPVKFLNEQHEAEESALQEKYGTPGQQALAGVESALSGATFGFSRQAENALGLTTPAAQAGREAANPITAGVGGFGGAAALLAATGGISGVAEAGTVAGKVALGALEGAGFGAGQLNADLAMGNADLNAQNIISYTGLGALLGGAGTGLIEGAKAGLGATKNSAVAKAIAKVYGGGEDIPPGAPPGVPPPGSGPVLDAPQTGVRPTNIDEIQARVAKAKESGVSLDLPQRASLEESVARYPMENPVHPLQVESLTDQRARDAYKVGLEMGDAGKALQQYEGIQKQEIVKTLEKDINNLAAGEKVTANAAEGGNIASDYFTNLYQAEKKESGELVGQIKKLQGEGFDHREGLISAWSDAVPQIGKMIDVEGNILAYNRTWGIPKTIYNNIKESITALKENPQDFESLFNIRDLLDEGISKVAPDIEKSMGVRLKAASMKYMQNMIDETMPEARDAFRRYAVNQENAAIIKRAFGADLNDTYEGALSRVQPDKILDRIFSNTANVSAAKKILPKEQFDHLLANWLSDIKNNAPMTDKGAFSSNKFQSFLNAKRDVLDIALSEHPEIYQRMKDGINIARILPDSPSVNPSGTAKTLIGYIKESRGLEEAGVNALKWLKEKTVGPVLEQMHIQELNHKLSGKATDASVLHKIEEAVLKSTKKMGVSAKAIFGSAPYETVTKAAIPAMVDYYDKHATKIKKLSEDSEELHKTLDKNGSELARPAPNITTSMNSATIRAVQFLSSKLPRPSQELPFSEPWEPSQIQKDKFNKYYAAVDDPMSALKQIKDGYLPNETMEALQAVHPELLREMQQKVMEHMTPNKKDMPYDRQLALSKFIGAPLSHMMVPQVIAANQAMFNMPLQGQTADASPMGRKRGGSSTSGMAKINVAQRSQTSTQDISKGKV